MNNEQKIIELLTEIRDSLKKPEPKKRGKAFTPPVMMDISAYCSSNNFKLDPQAFIDFYESKNWFVGKNKMKDWRAALRNWERRDKSNKKEPTIKKDWPPGFDPSRQCSSGESLEACKTRAWREHLRVN